MVKKKLNNLINKQIFRNLVYFILNVFRYIFYVLVIFLLIYSIFVFFCLGFYIIFTVIPSVKVLGVIKTNSFTFLPTSVIVLCILLLLIPIFSIRLLLFSLILLNFDYLFFDFIIKYHISRLDYFDEFATVFGSVKLSHLYSIQEKYSFILLQFSQNEMPYNESIIRQLVCLNSLQEIRDQINTLVYRKYEIYHVISVTISIIIPVLNAFSVCTTSNSSFANFVYVYIVTNSLSLLRFIFDEKIKRISQALIVTNRSLDLDFSNPFSLSIETFFTKNIFIDIYFFKILFKIGRILFEIYKFIIECVSYII